MGKFSTEFPPTQRLCTFILALFKCNDPKIVRWVSTGSNNMEYLKIDNSNWPSVKIVSMSRHMSYQCRDNNECQRHLVLATAWICDICTIDNRRDKNSPLQLLIQLSRIQRSGKVINIYFTDNLLSSVERRIGVCFYSQ